MNTSIDTISLARLTLAFLPVGVVVAILYRWQAEGGRAVYAMGRMLLQLLLVGYALGTIFSADHAGLVMAVLAVMLLAASWIALRGRRELYGKALGSIAAGGIVTLALVTQGVLTLDPWFEPRFMIPLAGMIFANAMNAVSLAAERYFAESERGMTYPDARRTALRASLIPITNSLFAVGLVSLPGMMTGQILSGVDPLIAARYQIMVMCMVYSSAGLSAALFLTWLKPVPQTAAAV